MSKEVLAKVVQRAISDAGFRRQLSSDPAGALRGFDLTTDEMSAIRTADAGRLSTLGIDQRMSKAFAVGSALAATRTAISDLGAANPSAIDDGTSAGGTIIPHDPSATITAQSARVGDDWKFTDRAAPDATSVGPEQHSVLSSDGIDPYASARDIGTGEIARDIATGEGSSALESARAGDDWARTGTRLDDSARVGSARLDDGGRASSASAINDDPDGFLAANARADTTGVPAAEGTNYIDDSESYLTQVGYDPSASSVRAKATWSGDENAGPTSVADDDAAGGSGPSEGGPNVDH